MELPEVRDLYNSTWVIWGTAGINNTVQLPEQNLPMIGQNLKIGWM